MNILPNFADTQADTQPAESAGLRFNRQTQLVIESVPAGIMIVDRHGAIALLNNNAAQMLGYETAELIGQPIDILLPKSVRANCTAERAAFFSNPNSTSIGTRRHLFAARKDGSEFPVELFLNLMEADGETWVLFSILDITARKHAEQAMQDDSSRLRAVMDTVVDGLITIDASGTIRSFNPAAERIFGYTEAEATGQNVKFLMAEPHDSAQANHLSSVGRQVSAKRKDGAVFPMEIAVGEMFLHDCRMYVGIVRDITERKQVEDERLQLIAHLKQSNQDLDDFAYIASHDLKEPLRGLSNQANFLKEDYKDLIDMAGANRLDRMIFLCRRMETLINDLLYFSKLGRQEFAFRKTDLNVLVQDILDQLEIAAVPNLSVRLASSLPSVVCDSTRVGEVFRNLLTNAIKYNDKPEKVVEIGYFAEYNGQPAVFYVKDNGIGIQPEYREDVFTLFKRLHPEDDAVRGSGVGLTFAKKILERHGGQIWLESKVAEGTTFFFTIGEKHCACSGGKGPAAKGRDA